MPRSNWKTPFIDKSLLTSFSKKKKKITWSRRSTIYPVCVGLELSIHNGKNMLNRKIKPEMVGNKLGEFVPTRKTPSKKKIKWHKKPIQQHYDPKIPFIKGTLIGTNLDFTTYYLEYATLWNHAA